MTTIKDILDYFEGFAPTESAMDFDNVGLLVGDKNAEVKRVLVSLDITREVVFEAETLGCSLIISHHPVIFNPVKRLSTSDVTYLLASKGISAVCMHTNLDLSFPFGVNTCLAEAIDLKNIYKSSYGECLFVGELEAETDIQAFVTNVKNSLSCNGLRYTDVKSKVKRVAVSSGAGGSEVFASIKENIDALVVGEIKHHEIIFANDNNINVIDVGHYKSEDIVILPLINRLRSQFSDITFTKSAVFSDNIKFI